MQEIAEELADMEHNSEVYSLMGQYDLAAIVEVKDNQSLEELMNDQILEEDGMRESETLIGSRVYSHLGFWTQCSLSGWRSNVAVTR